MTTECSQRAKPFYFSVLKSGSLPRKSHVIVEKCFIKRKIKMKNLILSLLILSSCAKEHQEDINCEYPTGIIYGKFRFGQTVWYDIKYKGEIITHVEAYDIDSSYQVGDTINKPCLGHK